MVLKIDSYFENSVKNQETNLMEMILVARKKRDFHLKLISEANKKKTKKENKFKVLKSRRTFFGGDHAPAVDVEKSDVSNIFKSFK